jgi:glycosyltransferase involved in cell wall biosynthesis
MSALETLPDPVPDFKVAVFHDNFAQNGGAERVAEELHRTLKAAFPHTDLFSTLSAEERLSPYLRNAKIRNTWMQRLPARAKLFRAYFLFYPFAIDDVDLSEYDLVVTSCFGYAKGVRRRSGALHICYSHTPMRWVWRTQDYLSREQNGRIKAALLALPLRWLKAWELRAAARPDLYIANSNIVADRLFRAFGVKATVIPPPIDTARFAPAAGTSIAAPEDFYLVLSRLVPYKRFDLAVEACTRSGRRLVVIGDGPDRARLEAMAGPTVTFLGRAPDEVVNDQARRCRALIFPGEEDFGMTPLEINAAGRPAVAFHAGGAVETVVEGLNGVFFHTASVEALLTAMDRFEAQSWDAEAIRRHAAEYDTKVFSKRITDFIQEAIAQRSNCEATSEAWVKA